MIKKTLPFFIFFLFLFNSSHLLFSGSHDSHHQVSMKTTSEDYKDCKEVNLKEQLIERVRLQPFNLIAFFIFAAAIIHAFFSHKFISIAHKIELSHKKKNMNLDDHHIRFSVDKRLESDVSFSAEIMHLLGEVEAVFGIWCVPLILSITYFFDWHTAVHYLENRNYTEPMFVVVIMAIAATKPIVLFAEKCLGYIAQLGKGTPASWWLTILTIGPILGSFITEPAAMTLCALLLSHRFYNLNPTPKFAYGTLGLLFVNISVGGVLTHFAAPPVLMVANVWNWDSWFMFTTFGWKAVIGIFISNALYFIYFRKDFKKLQKTSDKVAKNEVKKERPVPLWITIVHLCLLGWTIFTSHHPVLFAGSFLLFLAFYQATAPHQYLLSLRPPILVGCFLAGLVIHGGLQGWWIEISLTKVSEGTLMILSTVLTAFNDNAAITYLSSQVPSFTDGMKYAVVAGAVTGGGLTVIANAPNPAGFSLLNKYFKDGISPLGLFVSALVPTIIMGMCFMFL